jgi:putative oxidoreductase
MDLALTTTAVVLAGLFFVAGGAKIGGWLDGQFLAWGYSPGIAVLLGVFEVVFAIALLIDRGATWGAFGLMTIMLGALATHLTHFSPGEYTMSIVVIVVFALLGFVAWGRGPERDSAGRPVPSRA